jgi:RND family efflux transporter MFP subunit
MSNKSTIVKTIYKGLVSASAGALLIASLSGCSLMPQEEIPLPPPKQEVAKVVYETAKVEKKTVVKDLSVTTSFVPAKYIALGFKYPGLRLKSINVPKGAMVNQGDLLAEADSTALEGQLKQYEITLSKAQLTFAQNKLNNADAFTLQRSQLDLDLAKYNYDSIVKEIAKCKLYSPISGMIMSYDDKLKEGDSLDMGRTIISLADTSSLILQYEGSRDGDFKIGMKVDIKVDFRKNNQTETKTFQGEVAMTPSTAPADSSIKAVRFSVKGIEMSQVTPGMTAQVYTVINKRENVVAISNKALNRSGVSYFVYVMEDGISKERPVEVGLEGTNGDVEILSGLQAGDEIVLR